MRGSGSAGRHRPGTIALVALLVAASGTYAGDTLRGSAVEAYGGASRRSADAGTIAPSLERNDGQFDDEVDFVVRSEDATVFLADGALTYDAQEGDRGQAVRMEVVGADPDAAPVATGLASSTTNYFFGSDPAAWVTDVAAATTVEYHDIVDGVDIRYLGTGAGLRYDLVLDPGVDPATVELQFAGADGVRLNDTGALVVDVSVGDDLVFSSPVTYQPTDSGSIPVESSYVIGDDGTVGFEIGDHDPNLPVVIDPTLDLGTFLGGASTDSVTDVLVDGSGALIVVGTTASSTYPTTVGAYDTGYNGSNDLVVTKLNAAGTAVTWSTFIGSTTADDTARDAVIGLDGGIVIAASTTASGYPTTVGAYDTTFNTGTDIVVTRLSASGASLTFSSYLGSAGSDVPAGIDVDTSDRIVVVGSTDNSAFPLTSGVIDTTFGGATEGVATKFATGGASLAWSTFLGDSGSDAITDVDVDSTDDAHIAASTDAASAATPGAYDTTSNGGTDAVYGRLNGTATALEYATFLGGAGTDLLTSVVATSNSVVTVAGRTASNGFPTTAGAHDTSYGGANDGIVVKLDTSQSGSAQLRYSTFLGGTGADAIDGLAVDTYGRAVVTGDTASSGIATLGAPDTTQNGGADAFVATIDTGGTGLRFLSYAGGSGTDDGNSVALTSAGAAVVAGVTASSAFPTTSGAYDTSLGGATDGFVIRYSAVPAPAVALVNSTADGTDASAGNGVCSTTTAGQCTLRAAIEEANASATVNTIEFDIATTDSGYSAGRGVFTITPGSALPAISAGVTISGATQTTNVGNTNVGTLGVTQSVGTGADGVVGTGDELTIDGVARPEIEIALPGVPGFQIAAGSVTISGLAVYGGNSDVIVLSGSGVVIEDMVVGTKADSFTDPGAGVRGIGSAGVQISGGTNVTVRNNLIGYESLRGVGVVGVVTNATISGNEIRQNGRTSSSEGGGIEIVPYWGGGPIHGLTVSGNLITDHTNDLGIELAMLGTETGLLFENNTLTGNLNTAFYAYGATNSVGGVVRRNVVVGNLGHGLAVADVHNWAFLQNSIATNPWWGIAVDPAANDGLVAPTLTSALARSGVVTVAYSVTAPAGDYRVELFDNTTADWDFGEGETYRGAATIAHPGGTAAYTATIAGTSTDIISSTLTEDLGSGSYGSTSRFSNTVVASLDATLLVNSTGDAADTNPGDEVCTTGGTNSAGAAACTLRAAIQEANAHAVIDTVGFAMPTTEAGHAAGVWTITPSTVLPAISASATLDGTTQPGYTATPVVAVTGTSLPTGPGISVTGDDVTVRGLAVGDVPGDGLSVTGARATIESNHLGTDAAGTSAAGNTRFGIGVWGVDATITGNLVSGNLDDGLMLTGAHRAQITDNRFGTTVTGNAALPNGQEGIELTDADDVVIGTPGHGNVISGNHYAGINAWTTASTGVVVQANKIGVGADGTTALPNSAFVTEGGITFRGPTSGWLIGGTGVGEGNVIANNVGDGVQLFDGQGIADDIAVLGNTIHSNTDLGIDHGDDDVTANDAGDADTGANDLLNHPVISAASVSAGSASVSFTLDVPAGDYRVEFFGNTTADPSGYGEGETFVHAATVSHPGGAATYAGTFALSGGVALSATVTESIGGGTYGATSEFSPVFTSATPVAVVNSTGDAPDATPGNGVCDTGSTIVGGAVECTLRAAIDEANDNGIVNAVQFALPTSDANHASGTWSIRPASSPLPTVTAPVIIDATTQPGWSGSPVVRLDGSLRSGSDDGLDIAADDSTVAGLSITGWPDDGLATTSARTVVRANWFGVTPTGSAAHNAQADIVVWSVSLPATAVDVVVGGTDVADRNVFATGDGEAGVVIWNAEGTLVGGNLVGLGADGVTDLAGDGPGVRVGGQSTATTVTGNRFGALAGAAVVHEDDASGTVVTANVIGVDTAGGAAPVSSGLEASSSGGVTFGGTSPADGNTVRNTVVDGVRVRPWATGAVTAIGNSIAGSGELAIDLDDDGVTVNDALDVDTGSNGRLNFPVVVAAGSAFGRATVDVDLDVAAGTYRLELFVNPSGADPSTYGEAEQLVGATTVVHAGGGSQRFSVPVVADVGDVLTATVTQDLGIGGYGATSELSAAFTVTAAAAVRDQSRRRSDLVAAGGAGAAVGGVGVVASGLDLGGGAQRLVGPATEIDAGALTLSGWIRLDAAGTAPRLLAKSTGSGTSIHELLVDGTTGEAVARLVIGASTVEVRGGSVGTGAWHQVAATWDGATVRLYVDGVAVDAVAAAGTLGSDLAAPVVVGNTANAIRGVDGRLDQVRISHTARSADEIATEHTNVTQPTAFVTMGASQTAAPGAWTAGSSVRRSGSHALVAPQATSGSAAWATVRGIDEPGLSFEAWWFVTGAAPSQVAGGTNTGRAPTDQWESGLGGGTVDIASSVGGTRSVDQSVSGTVADGTWTRVEIRTDEQGRSSVWIGGVEVIGPTSHSAGGGTGSAGLLATTLQGEQWYVDDVLVRRYVSDEPTATLGPITRN